MDHLGVFAKYWQPGLVKTRLAVAIGDLPAAKLYREFVWQTLNRLAHVADNRCLYVWPVDQLPRFQAMARDEWSLATQSSGDLGKKMSAFFHSTLGPASKIRRSVLIGSDTPCVQPSRVQRAFQLLADCDCVLGPASDGGYYLLGLKQPAESLFQGISWSTPQVHQQTIHRLDQLGWSWQELPRENDIDDMQDLRGLVNQLQQIPQPGVWDVRLLDAINRWGSPTA